MAPNTNRPFTALISNIILLFLLFSFTNTYAQSDSVFLVRFIDKGTVQVTDDPGTLSSKALVRRKKYTIPVNVQDLPLNRKYIDTVLENTEVQIRYSLKWYNAIVVNATQKAIAEIKELAFVTGINYVGLTSPTDSIASPLHTTLILKLKDSEMNTADLSEADYGVSYGQNRQIGVTNLHKLGYNGNGITVAIFDAGFKNIDKIPAFLKHQANGKLTLGYDAADLDNEFIRSDNHGTAVSSCTGAYDKGKYIGSAPLAHYILYRSERGATETPLEELNWCKVAELADSAGVDMITSSLGYNQYDDKTLSYTQSQLDGSTSFISFGAKIAVEKGILVLNSAGNSGDNKWRKIGTPADVATVLTVGAVDLKDKYGKFSSQGNAADGTTKPDISALGVLAYVGSASGGYYQGYGTSYATPIAAGGVACLLQAFPELTPREINDIIRNTATRTSSPDSFVGYGVARFDLAYELQTHINSSPSTPKVIKIDENQVILYTAGMKEIHFTLSRRKKLFGLFHVNKKILKEEIFTEKSILNISLSKYKIKCSQKHTVKIKLKSNADTYKLTDNELYPCSH
jgi:subtilisin family serine protease